MTGFSLPKFNKSAIVFQTVSIHVNLLSQRVDTNNKPHFNETKIRLHKVTVLSSNFRLFSDCVLTFRKKEK